MLTVTEKVSISKMSTQLKPRKCRRGGKIMYRAHTIDIKAFTLAPIHLTSGILP